MYRRPILCTIYGALDFLNGLKKGCCGGGGGVLLVHNEILYVPLGDGWEEVLVRNVLHVRITLRTSTSSSLNIMSLPGIEHSPPLIKCGHSTIGP